MSKKKLNKIQTVDDNMFTGWSNQQRKRMENRGGNKKKHKINKMFKLNKIYTNKYKQNVKLLLF